MSEADVAKVERISQTERRVPAGEMHGILTFTFPVLKDPHKHGSCPRNDALGRFSDIVLVVLVLLCKALLDVELGKRSRNIRPRTPFVAGVDARDFAAVLIGWGQKIFARNCEASTTRRSSYLQN